MDDIIFCCLKRADDEAFLDAVKDYEDGFKMFIPEDSLSAGTENFDTDTLP